MLHLFSGLSTWAIGSLKKSCKSQQVNMLELEYFALELEHFYLQINDVISAFVLNQNPDISLNGILGLLYIV